jgi:hypothetical protein
MQENLKKIVGNFILHQNIYWQQARPGRDADHSPPSSAEVLNE